MNLLTRGDISLFFLMMNLGHSDIIDNNPLKLLICNASVLRWNIVWIET